MFSLTRFIAAIAILLSLFIPPAWSQDGRVAIQANTPPSLERATFVKRSDPHGMMEIVVGLKMRNEQDLDDLITRQQDSASPDYHRFITPADFADRFAPAQSDVDNVSSYLESQGFSVLQVTPNRMLIQARGTVGQIEQAFQVSINDYDLGGRQHFSNDHDPSVPAQLKDIVRSRGGLSSLENRHSMVVPGALAPTVIFTPQQIAKAYNYPNVLTKPIKPPYDGSGVTIAIATAFSFASSDVDFFWQYLKIVRTGAVTTVPVNGGSSQTGFETTLDIQQAGAQAPGSNLLVYTIPGDANGFASNVNFQIMFSQIVSDNSASIVSHSWGNCEKNYGSAQMQSDDATFKQGTAQGISFFASSGDNGAYLCGGTDTNLAVDFPASDPYVTGVGGTSLTLNSKGTRSSETAWTGSGGGISQVFPLPSWQSGRVPPSHWRSLPDIALDADQNTPYYAYFQGQWRASGGTSFASPNWAALWALGIQAIKGHRTGQAAPLLYKLAASSVYHFNLHDITTGNNGGGVGPGYKAGKNWDYPTGWGTPNGANLVKWLISNP
jgi:subtilase family serine protease